MGFIKTLGIVFILLALVGIIMSSAQHSEAERQIRLMEVSNSFKETLGSSGYDEKFIEMMKSEVNSAYYMSILAYLLNGVLGYCLILIDKKFAMIEANKNIPVAR
ncbi:hypothetical protein V7O62_11065 [Methanolobus sp. ZRKC2]|uniref:hypothetical protein n=1 Tax=Methanolobus sp. ZRKC2 TaxID=3125783 RepID=UPI003252C5FE